MIVRFGVRKWPNSYINKHTREAEEVDFDNVRERVLHSIM